MHNVTFWLLAAFVFSLAWEGFVVGPIGGVSRLAGIVAVAGGAITIAATGRVRAPGVVVSFAFIFTWLSILSLLWTIEEGVGSARAITYAQLVGLVWLVWEFAREREEQEVLMIAYCAGAYATAARMLTEFLSLSDVRYSRFTVSGFDMNDLGLSLAIGIPLAWHLFLTRRGFVRLLGATYLPFCAIAVFLTGSRGGLLAGLVACSILPLTVARRSVGSIVRVGAVVAVVLLTASVAAALIVPQATWDRLMTTTDEIAGGGTLSGRVEIWRAGLEAFHERPVLGAGVGAFESAVEPLIGPGSSAHNTFLAILVEQGVVGFFVFGLLLAACVGALFRVPPATRKVWGVVLLTWTVGGMSLGWQHDKVTWLMFGLIAAQTSATARRAVNGDRERDSGARYQLDAANGAGALGSRRAMARDRVAGLEGY